MTDPTDKKKKESDGNLIYSNKLSSVSSLSTQNAQKFYLEILTVKQISNISSFSFDINVPL